MEAELYDPTGFLCEECGQAWRPTRVDAPRICPSCGSTSVGFSYPEIPTLDHDPGLALILAVEGQIQRTEGGSVDLLAMLAWLELHGVRDRAEILTWEWFFREIGVMRARIMEEITALPPKDDAKEPED